ncbi:hypothetical protein KFK09_017234 [Dendrobium nobile]|uniref:Uncharacterized protein n=1 Tax=Dendrobium nobile TaxID=94219 RepID=A0A8T3B1M5_DENNO|nr:hypothetical protein KFK09_017234 [Dendrobium nobile]
MDTELPVFTQEEMAIDEAQGFPKAYALLCKNSVTISPFAHGPPHSFIPYALQSQEVLKVKKLNQMFPIIDPEACSFANLRSYVDFLWEKLDHLGNAEFEPALFRVDCFGNLVYRNADPASPLAWDIDHWFPCSRGGKTVPSNLRILQRQVCKKKKNKLDFLIPWWDLQLGISVNQFLSIFASRNLDFRRRAFSFFFPDGGGEELNCLQNLYLHSFTQKFTDAKSKQGLAAVTTLLSQNSSDRMVLKSVDLNKSLRQNSPFPASMKTFHKEDVANQELRRLRSSISKENNQPLVDDHESNPYLTISQARDSLRQRKEARKLQAEISQLDEKLNELKQKSYLERLTLKELEAEIVKRRKRVEKCRQLSEAQACYHSLLEKMMKDTMNQTVVYKDQLRLNQEISNTIMARLEAQRAGRDASENVLHRKYKQRDELEVHAIACSEQGPKRSQIYDDFHENNNSLSSTKKVRTPTKKKLRVFLEEEQKAFEAGISLSFDDQEESEESTSIANDKEDHCQPSKANKIQDDILLNSKLKGIALGEESYERTNNQKRQISYPYSSLDIVEGDGTNLFSKNKNLNVSNKLKQIQHRELNVIKTNKSCKKINDPENHTSFPSHSSYNVKGHDAILVSNKLKEVQKRGLEAIKLNESQKQWNLTSSSREQQEEDIEFQNRVGKVNVEKWLQILLKNAKEGSPYSGSHPTPKNFDEPTINTNIEMKQNEIELSTITKAREKQRSDKMDSEKRFNTTGSAWNVASTSWKKSKVEDTEEIKADSPKCESSRRFISFLSSPAKIWRMRKGVEWMRRKPKFTSDDEDVNLSCNFMNSNMISNIVSKTTKKESKK